MNQYEDLMRWVINDLRDMSKRDARFVSKQLNNYVMNAVMNLDIHGVVDRNNFPLFLNDLKQRVGLT